MIPKFAEISESVLAFLPDFGSFVLHENILVAEVGLGFDGEVVEDPHVTISPLHGREFFPTAELLDVSDDGERLAHARLELNPEGEPVGRVVILDVVWIKKRLDCDAVGNIVTNLTVRFGLQI